MAEIKEPKGQPLISSQLGRTVLAGSSSSADEQASSPDEHGSYGELIDLIDRLLEEDDEEQD